MNNQAPASFAALLAKRNQEWDSKSYGFGTVVPRQEEKNKFK
jgi:hypothetical protein